MRIRGPKVGVPIALYNTPVRKTALEPRTMDIQFPVFKLTVRDDMVCQYH